MGHAKIIRWVLTLSIAMLVLVAGIMWLWPTGTADTGAGEGAQPAVKSAASTARPVLPKAGQASPQVSEAEKARPAPPVTPEPVIIPSAPLPQTAAAVAGAAKVAPPAVKKRRVEVIPGISTNPPPPTGFSSPTEALINMIVNTPLGSPPPSLPRVPPREDFAKIFETDILVYDEDDEQTVAAKINVAKAKEYLKEYLEQGGTPDGFLTYYHDELRAAHQEWMLARKQALDLIKAGDAEGALLYVQEQNRAFAERGIKPIVIPGL
jgi:hypothetical protein